jgi:hypothetical protein
MAKKRKPPAFFDLNRWGRGIGPIKPKPAKIEPVKINVDPPFFPKNKREKVAALLGLNQFVPKVRGHWSEDEDGEEFYRPPVPGAGTAKTFSSAAAFGLALERRGFKRLGAGAYSTVYGKPGSDKVIKVTRSLDDWIDYIQWGASKGYSGSYVPKVYSWKRFPGDEKSKRYEWQQPQFAVAVVERMEYTLSSEMGLKSDFLVLERLARAAVRGNDMCHLVCEDVAPGYIGFLKELKKTFDSDDMYGKNLMIRKDGTFCVTDPVCGKIKTSATRLRSRDFTSLAPAIFREYYESICFIVSRL